MWVKWNIKKFSNERDDVRGTGGELARHLLDERDMTDVSVEITSEGADHYSPVEKAVRLSPSHFHGKSVSAIAIATHEVSHAIQHHQAYQPLMRSGQLIKMLNPLQTISNIAIYAIGSFGIITQNPLMLRMIIAVLVITYILRIGVRILNLPVEFDASFNRALPILVKGQYLSHDDIPVAKKILKAAALTYVASALASIYDIRNLLILIRRR